MSWVWGISISRAARTAFSDFSTACWVRKPIVWDAWPSAATRVLAACNSPCALLSSNPATSLCSGDKDSALSQCTLDHRARHLRPSLRLRFVDDNDIDRDFEAAEASADPHGLLARALDLRLDDEQVKVA